MWRSTEEEDRAVFVSLCVLCWWGFFCLVFLGFFFVLFLFLWVV